MKCIFLSELVSAAPVAADLLIVGGGPVGLTIARHCGESGLKVIVLESGLEQEDDAYEALNEVDSVGQPSSAAQQAKRAEFHAVNARYWSGSRQRFGVRCRALGGSTHAWAGKSALFDEIDFAERDWVENSGWPIGRDDLESYFLRAMEVLNLCPAEPPAMFEDPRLRSFFWQFARSRVDRMDIMRFGRELKDALPNTVQVVLDATVTDIGLSENGTRVEQVEAQNLAGEVVRFEPRACVLAAGGIENPRLLLACNAVQSRGIGNEFDNVGRYLMDHPSSKVATADEAAVGSLANTFGFYGVRHRGRAHMFMHGLALTPEVQREEGLLNAAVFFMPTRAPDDPWDSLKRLLMRRSDQYGRDAISVVRGAGLLAKGIGMKLLAHDRMPQFAKEAIVNAAIRFSPNAVASEFQDRGLPHKLSGLTVEAISEQAPNRESRITLSARKDRFGMPLAQVDWRIGEQEQRTMRALAKLVASTFAERKLPPLSLDGWVASPETETPTIIDMGHTLGATRMSSDPRTGVVDADCKVFGVDNLYVAGGSVFPTSGHANPTLMLLTLAIRLADNLQGKLSGAR